MHCEMWAGWFFSFFRGYPCQTNEPAELAGGIGRQCGLEQSKAHRLLWFTGPVISLWGVLLWQRCNSNNLSCRLPPARHPDPLRGGIEETPARKSFQNGSSDHCRTFFFPRLAPRVGAVLSPDVDFHTKISSVRSGNGERLTRHMRVCARTVFVLFARP